MNRKFLFTCIALLAMTATAFGQPADDLRGTWALQVDGRNLVVLHLEGESLQLSGTLARPYGVVFGPTNSAGTSVSQVKTPLFTVQVKEVRATAAGRVFTLSYESNDAGEIVLRSDGPDRARFGFAASAPENSLLPLTRVSDTATVAADWNSNQTYVIRAPAVLPNAEMAAIMDEDQADRQGGPGAVDWSVVGPRDEARRQRVRTLLDAGQLRAAYDFYAAAFVFQHGSKPEDYLLAHVLAMSAMTLGRNDAAWIATATLDRYLQNTDRSQIFGTQYVGGSAGPMDQGKYDKALIPDSLRRILGVPTLEQQEAQLKQLNSR